MKTLLSIPDSLLRATARLSYGEITYACVPLLAPVYGWELTGTRMLSLMVMIGV